MTDQQLRSLQGQRYHTQTSPWMYLTALRIHLPAPCTSTTINGRVSQLKQLCGEAPAFNWSYMRPSYLKVAWSQLCYPFFKWEGESVGYQNWTKCLKWEHTRDLYSCIAMLSVLFSSLFLVITPILAGVLVCLVLLCCWIDNIMDSPIKPPRKEILELIAGSETITECVFPPTCITAHLSTMNFICHFVKVFDDMSLGIHSCKLHLPCRVGSAELRTGCLELSHQHRGNKSVGKLHQHRIVNSS